MKDVRNAFLIIDMQKDFLLDGAPFQVAQGLDTMPFIEKALEASREYGIPVFHVFRNYRANGVDVEVTRYAGFKKAGGGNVTGTAGAEIMDSIKPIEGEYMIMKNRWSAFFQTELDLILRTLGVRQVILTGVQTPNCIRGTAWDSNSLGYETIVLTDGTEAATTEVHEANLYDMANIGVKLMTTEEYVQSLKEDPLGPKADLVHQIREEVLSSDKAPEPVHMYDEVK